jgi:hypothetical protein
MMATPGPGVGSELLAVVAGVGGAVTRIGFFPRSRPKSVPYSPWRKAFRMATVEVIRQSFVTLFSVMA